MHIALVAHVEHQPVPAGIEYPVDGHRQLHRTQIGGQMAAGFGNILHKEAPDLPAQLRKLCLGKGPDVLRAVDSL